jgi:hypothetical protein
MQRSKWLGSGLMAAVAVALGLVALSSASAQTGATISVEAATVDVGAQGTANVQALGVTAPGLGGWTLDITYDPAAATVTGCTSTAGLCNPNFAPDTVRVTGFNATGMLGDATLATIEVQCAAVGSSPLTLAVVDFLDATPGNPTLIQAAATNGSVSCATPAPSDSGALEAVEAPAAGTLPVSGGLPPLTEESALSWTYLVMGAGIAVLAAGGVLLLKARRLR